MVKMLTPVKLAKFGGTSLATSEAVSHVNYIMQDDPDRMYGVLSAPGKRFDNDIKVTDLLINLATCRSIKSDPKDLIDNIVSRYKEIYLDCKNVEDVVYSELIRRANQNLDSQAYLASLKAFGEEANARCFAKNFGFKYVDPRVFMRLSSSHDNAVVLPETYNLIKKIFEENKGEKLIFPGFFGYLENSEIATFARGGSDYTGAILAKGLRVSVYENFTDCPILAADPRIVNKPIAIDEMTYKELGDLSYSGFNIFYRGATFPLLGTTIATHVRGTNDYPKEGTWVRNDRVSNFSRPILGVAYQDGFCTFSISKPGLNGMTGILHEITGVFAKRGIGIEYPPVGVDDVSIVASQEGVKNLVDEIKKDLEEIVGLSEPPKFKEHQGCLVIAGKGLKYHQETLWQVIKSLTDKNIYIMSMSHGDERRCVMFGLSKKDGHKAVQVVYENFINQKAA